MLRTGLSHFGAVMETQVVKTYRVSNASEGRRGCGLVRFVMLEFICILGVFIAGRET